MLPSFATFVGVIALCLSISMHIIEAASSCGVSDQDKTDCGYVGVNQTQCEAKGCCWQTSSTNGIPWCYYTYTTSTVCVGYQSSLSEAFSTAELNTMKSYFKANINIQGSGGIVASSQKDHDPDYYFHWMRDGALSMKTHIETANSFSEVQSDVKAYIQWVIGVQHVSDPNGIDVRVEPKFNLPGGTPYTGGWCRPQNDGPGLRATTLMLAADSLTAAGDSATVSSYLWTNNANAYSGGAIKFDLDWLANNGYASHTCDLWEELESDDLFWNRITSKRALLLGAQFATKMGDSVSASKYTDAANTISATLYYAHVSNGFVQEAPTRVRDGAVIVALNDGYSGDGVFAPTSAEVANTVATYNDMFCDEYPVNQADYAKGLPGVLYGRYKGDAYFGGNPWILTTAALASLYYRAALYVLQTSSIPSSAVLSTWQRAMNAPANIWSINTDAHSVAKVFAQQGDGVLLRLRAHVSGDNFSLKEQIDKNTGLQSSADNLTWSYAEVFNAMKHRNDYLKAASR